MEITALPNYIAAQTRLLPIVSGLDMWVGEMKQLQDLDSLNTWNLP